jgi:5-methylcytosine-specific restriction endonuclease McrA
MARSGNQVDIRNGISADLIIRAMVGLLEARRTCKIKRLTFLKTWGRLRRLLALTPEYARWRWNVRERAGGACERCAEVGHHAHHKVPVAHEPARALDPENGEYLCRRCHKAEHRESRRARLDAPPPHPASSPAPSHARPLPARARTQPPAPRR